MRSGSGGKRTIWIICRTGNSTCGVCATWPKPILENSAGLYLYDDRVAVISALKENYAMIIESSELSLLVRTIWNCIWEVAEEPKSSHEHA